MSVKYASCAMPDHMDFSSRVLREEGLETIRGVACSAVLPGRGAHGVFLHLIPLGLAGERPCNRLEEIVEAVEHKVFCRIQHTLRPAASYRVLQHKFQRRPVVAVPDK